MRGHFGIGIVKGKSAVNIGTLWRSAYQFGAAYIFTIGRRYEKQSSDTVKAWRHIPLFNYANMDDFLSHRPYSSPLIGIEMGGRPLVNFVHPERAIYLLGAEDHGLTQAQLAVCNQIIEIPTPGVPSLNVAVAGSIVMYDRTSKNGWRL